MFPILSDEEIKRRNAWWGYIPARASAWPHGVISQMDIAVDEYDIVADQLDRVTQATLLEQRKAAGQCTKCGTLLPMSWMGLGACQKGCGK